MTITSLIRTFVLAGTVASVMLLPSTPTSAMPQVSQSVNPAVFSTRNADNSNALNWAGYVASVGTYTSVSGSWMVPSVQSSAVNSADATWVGIGGVVSTDLIQAGTEAVPDSHGNLVYQAWLETLPQDSRVVPLSISAGDTVSVSITEASAGLWQVSFEDSTTGQTYDTSVRYNSSLSSAEWIEEMPVEVGGVIGLDNFGTVNFTSGYAIKNGQAVTIASSGAKELTMNNSSGQTVAAPSNLGEGGASFSVSRTSAASTPLALTRNGVAVVAAASTPYANVSSGNYGHGSYTTHLRRGRGNYRVVIQFQ